MKNKGYILTIDAIIALIFVVGVFIVIISLEFFNPEETSKTAFLNLHYLSEDVLDVLNKKGTLDDIGYQWSLNTSEGLNISENITKEYLDLIIPKHIGYKLEITETDENGNIISITNISNSDDYGTRPKMSDATVLTHSSRLLVGFGINKPVIGNVARSYIVVEGFNFSGSIWDIIECSTLENILLSALDQPEFCGEEPSACCVGDNCGTIDVMKPGGISECAEVCYGCNCTVGSLNSVNEDFDALCCGLGECPCTIDIGNNLKGDLSEHSTTATCCGDECHTDMLLGNNIEKGVDLICCGDRCNTTVDTGNNNIQTAPNNIGCIGDNCNVNVTANKITGTTIFCDGKDCSVNVQIDSIVPSSPEIFCCGNGCTINCVGCPANFEIPCPGALPYNFCEMCDEYCYSEAEVFTFYVPYHEPLSKVAGSKKITIYMDTDGDNTQDGNCTIDEWGPIPDDPAGFDPYEDAIDNGLMYLLNEVNLLNDINSNATPLMDNTTEIPGGDGGYSNPIDLYLNCSDIKIDAVRVENIRSLWGPAQFKLIVWM